MKRVVFQTFSFTLVFFSMNNESFTVTPNEFGLANITCKINSANNPQFLIIIKGQQWIYQVSKLDSPYGPISNCTPGNQGSHICKELGMDNFPAVMKNSTVYISVNYNKCPSNNGITLQCFQKYGNGLNDPEDIPGDKFQIQCPEQPTTPKPISNETLRTIHQVYTTKQVFASSSSTEKPTEGKNTSHFSSGAPSTESVSNETDGRRRRSSTTTRSFIDKKIIKDKTDGYKTATIILGVFLGISIIIIIFLGIIIYTCVKAKRRSQGNEAEMLKNLNNGNIEEREIPIAGDVEDV